MEDPEIPQIQGTKSPMEKRVITLKKDDYTTDRKEIAKKPPKRILVDEKGVPIELSTDINITVVIHYVDHPIHYTIPTKPDSWKLDPKTKRVHVNVSLEDLNTYMNFISKQPSDKDEKNFNIFEANSFLRAYMHMYAMPRMVAELAVGMKGQDYFREEHNVKLTKPQNSSILTSLLTRQLMTSKETIMPSEYYTITTNTLPKKKIVTTTQILALPNKKLGITLEAGLKLTPYHKSIMDAVSTLWVNGYRYVTIEMIIRVREGNYNPAKKITENKIDRAKLALKELMCSAITIDANDELIAKGLVTKEEIEKDPTGYYFGGNLLNLYTCPIKTQGGKLIPKGIEILAEPPLLSYGKMLNQVSSFPTELLENNDKTTRSTDDFVTLEWLIIGKIEAMKNVNNDYETNKISLEWFDKNEGGKRKGLLEDLGYKPEDCANYQQWKKKKSAIHKDILSILDHLIDKQYIKDYSIYKHGNAIAGYKIIY